MSSSSSASAVVPVPVLSFSDKVVVVTGGGSGIGKALCDAFVEAGAGVGVALDLPHKLSSTSNGRVWSLPCDVTCPSQVSQTIQSIKNRTHNKIDIYCSNAGILVPSDDATNDSCVKHGVEEWNRILQVNLISHITALTCLLPDWERGIGDGHFCVTASAAGLLTMVGDASYGVSKAAAVSFCEHVQIAHSPSVKVHCLCPQAVSHTNLMPITNTDSSSHNTNAAMTDGALSPQEVACATLQGIQNNDFFIFPHTTVPKYVLRKAQNHKRWIQGMQRMRNTLFPQQQQQQQQQDEDSGTKLLLQRSKL
ncbi:KR domain [Seminavis robusta]|uniref:KR domain n=1 Tax=Seminavis robusta TaxID=568900 RepID=A0A9N8HD10_9STRA|nr:KR domain [Seminavis robusta]|eukprot:Sro340_g121320.1 KR domain (308) ;mRNA; f:74064-74987